MYVCVSEFLPCFLVQLNSYALTYDRHFAGLIEVLFTMCGGVTALAFLCVCVCLSVCYRAGDINVYYAPSRLAIAPRA